MQFAPSRTGASWTTQRGGGRSPQEEAFRRSLEPRMCIRMPHAACGSFRQYMGGVSWSLVAGGADVSMCARVRAMLISIVRSEGRRGKCGHGRAQYIYSYS
eukprot:scaffold15256_cov126-Isochrysis_galbana.AAC.1